MSPGRILVAEDNALVRDLIVAALAAEHEVVAVATSSEAIGLVDDETIVLDVVVTDANLGDENAGRLLDTVHRRRPRTRTVVISGQASARRMDPCSTFLAKPFGSGELVECVQALLLRDSS